VTLVALKSGAFHLDARPSTGTGLSLPIQAADPDKATSAAQLPFVGGGWGSIVGGITIAVLATALGVMQVLDGAVIATLYGALGGYFFGATVATKNSGSGGSDSGGSGSGPGGTTADANADES